MARCIDPDHGIGDHPCAEVMPMLTLQLPADIVGLVYQSLFERMEDVDHMDPTPERLSQSAALEYTLALLATVAERAGVPLPYPIGPGMRHDADVLDKALERS